MAALALRREEGLGLGIAIAAHLALLAVLVLRPESHEVVKPPERIEVTLSDDVGLTSTSPDPSAEAAPDIAPTLGESAPMAAPQVAPLFPPPPEPVALPEPEPAPAPAVDDRPRRRPEQARNEPRPVAKPAPRPVPPKAATKPKPATKQAAPPAPPRAAPKPAATPASRAGGSRLGADFLDGVQGGQASRTSGTPAAAIGPRVQSSLAGAIRRQLKPHWQAPQGADAELLVTRVRFRLNKDGSLAGEPQVLATSGRNAANEAQVSRHQEQAVRAVKLAAPFDLPEEFYSGWQVITTNFDRGLSQ